MIAVLYTRNHGKLTCAAKGARRKKSQFTGNLDLFNQLEVAYYDSTARKQDIHTLIDCQLVNPYLFIRKNVLCFTAASYMAELVMLLTPEEDPDDKIFLLFDSSLSALENSNSVMITLRLFEIKLLSYTGLLSDTITCSRCSNELNSSAFIGAFAGTITCRNCKTGSSHVIDSGTLKVFSHLYKTDPGKPVRLKLADRQLKQLGLLLSNLIDHACDRPLKTRKILDGILLNEVS